MGVAAAWGVLILVGLGIGLKSLHDEVGHCLFCLGDDVDDEHSWPCKWCEKGKETTGCNPPAPPASESGEASGEESLK